MKKTSFLASLMIAATTLLSVGVQAQEPDAPSKVEVGVHFTSLAPSYPAGPGGLGVLSGTNEAGFGGRFTFNLTKNVALEAEGNFFPHEFSTDFAHGGRLLQGHFGVKAGKRFGKF